MDRLRRFASLSFVALGSIVVASFPACATSPSTGYTEPDGAPPAQDASVSPAKDGETPPPDASEAAVDAAVDAGPPVDAAWTGRPPAAPLIVRNPYLSTWSAADAPNQTWPTFWNGATKAITGIARI